MWEVIRFFAGGGTIFRGISYEIPILLHFRVVIHIFIFLIRIIPVGLPATWTGSHRGDRFLCYCPNPLRKDLDIHDIRDLKSTLQDNITENTPNQSMSFQSVHSLFDDPLLFAKKLSILVICLLKQITSEFFTQTDNIPRRFIPDFNRTIPIDDIRQYRHSQMVRLTVFFSDLLIPSWRGYITRYHYIADCIYGSTTAGLDPHGY